MLRVGLTGGAASGKSVAARIFREFGAHISQSDEIARAMMRAGEPLYLAFVQHFGNEILLASGDLDRRALARIAFQEGRVEELNALVHPPVIAAQQQWMDRIAKDDPNGVAIVESALLLETRHGAGEGTQVSAAPWRTRFDRVILVTAPEKLRIERYIARAYASDSAADRTTLEQDARLRFAAQMPEEQKAALADVVIENDGNLQALREKVVAVYRDLQAEAREQDTGTM